MRSPGATAVMYMSTVSSSFHVQTSEYESTHGNQRLKNTTHLKHNSFLTGELLSHVKFVMHTGRSFRGRTWKDELLGRALFRPCQERRTWFLLLVSQEKTRWPDETASGLLKKNYGLCRFQRNDLRDFGHVPAIMPYVSVGRRMTSSPFPWSVSVACIELMWHDSK